MTPQRLRPTATRPSQVDSDRFERVFRDHYDAVLAYTLARATTELAKDAAAQTFLVAWRRREELPQSPRGWLLGVARRSLADLRRSRDRRIALGTRAYLLNEGDPSAADAAEIVTQRDAVHATLAQLPPADAELLRLIAWDCLSYREAADCLGCTSATLSVRLHRARRRFEQIFDPQRSSMRPQMPSPAPSLAISSAEALTQEAP